MAQLKTQVNKASVAAFLAAIPEEERRRDCRKIAAMMEAATKTKAEMWGAGIVGFGRRRIAYAGGREGEWPVIGFAPRKQNVVLYIMDGRKELDALEDKLGSHSRGKGCLYIKRLADVDLPTLEKLVRQSVRQRSKPDPST